MQLAANTPHWQRKPRTVLEGPAQWLSPGVLHWQPLVCCVCLVLETPCHRREPGHSVPDLRWAGHQPSPSLTLPGLSVYEMVRLLQKAERAFGFELLWLCAWKQQQQNSPKPKNHKEPGDLLETGQGRKKAHTQTNKSLTSRTAYLTSSRGAQVSKMPSENPPSLTAGPEFRKVDVQCRPQYAQVHPEGCVTALCGTQPLFIALIFNCV